MPPHELSVDESGTTVVFRVENQHCAAWGVAVADLHRADPPVYVQDRDGGSWKPFLDRVSVACAEMVFSEVVTGRGSSGDMCELPGGLIAVAESACEQMAVPEYRLCAGSPRPASFSGWTGADHVAGCWPGADPGRSGSHSRSRPRALGACPPSRPETRQPHLTRSSSRQNSEFST